MLFINRPNCGVTKVLDIGMSPSWNLEELREHVRRIGGEDDLLEIIHSIDRAILIFRYHLFTARDALKGIIDETDPTGIINTSFVFGASDRQEEYVYAKIVNEANVIGCIHAVRSIYDIFAQLANGLLLNCSIPLHLCDVGRVQESIPKSELKTQLGKLLDSDWFNYIVGFINTTKHRRLVQHQFSVSFEHGIAGIRLGAFEYKGRSFPSYWGTEVLQGALEVKNTVIDCGRALNQLCGATNA